MNLASLMVVFAASLVAAQDVQIQNFAPTARTQWVRVVHPKGMVPCKNEIALQVVSGDQIGKDHQTAHILVAAESLGMLQDRLLDGGGPLPATSEVPPYSVSDTAVGGRLPFDVFLGEEPWRDVALDMNVDGPCLIVHGVGRIPGSMLVVDFWAYVYPKQPIVEVELLVVSSDPSVPFVRQDVSRLEVRCDPGVEVSVEHSAWRGARQLSPQSAELLANTWIGDAQGQAWRLWLSFPEFSTPKHRETAKACAEAPIVAVYRGLPLSKTWGAFGVASIGEYTRWPELEASVPGRLASPSSGYFSAGWRGSVANSGSTGGQDDFGSSKGFELWSSPRCAHVLELVAAGMQEACRPNDYREVDGRMIAWRDHPRCVFWSGQPHWSRGVSPDRLGKEGDPRQNGGWYGPDREHWSNHALTNSYLLTGSRLLLHMVKRQVLCYLMGETLDPRLSTSNAGPARGIGRSLLSGVNMLRCLDPVSLDAQDLRQRMIDRLNLVVRPQVWKPEEHAVRPISIYVDRRVLVDEAGVPVPAWRPWDEAIGIVGLRAAQLHLESEEAFEVLKMTCRTVVRSGWRRNPLHGGWTALHAVAYRDGAGITDAEYFTPGCTTWAQGVSFEDWTAPALVVGAAVLEGEDRELAARILAEIAAENPPGPNRSSYHDWRALR